MSVQVEHKKPRKEVVRAVPHDINRQIREIEKKQFEFKRWIRDYYQGSK